MTNIYFTEIIPSHNCSKGKEQHTQCNKDISKVTESYVECTLCQFGTGLSIAEYASGQDNQSCQCQNNKCIDKYTHHCDDSLITRILNLCCCMCMWCGTHTCFVGEKSSRNTETHRFLNRYTKHAACDCLWCKSTHKNIFECSSNPRKMHHQDHKASDDV